MNITRRHNQKRRRSAQKRAAEETVRRLLAYNGGTRIRVDADLSAPMPDASFNIIAHYVKGGLWR